jgi:excisionase family DNA binding protein
MNKILLSLEEATQALGVGRSTLYKLIDAGRISRIKLGSRALIPHSALERLARELEEETARTDRGEKK